VPAQQKISPKGSLILSMESLVMDKLLVSWWAITLSADGSLAIGAAVLIVLILAVAGRWRSEWTQEVRQGSDGPRVVARSVDFEKTQNNLVLGERPNC
jgi:hypothetical protein